MRCGRKLWVTASGLSQGKDGLSRLGYPLWSAVPTHLVNCRSLVSMLRWRMHMRVSAEPMSRVAPGKEASCMGRSLAGGASAVPASGH